MPYRLWRTTSPPPLLRPLPSPLRPLLPWLLFLPLEPRLLLPWRRSLLWSLLAKSNSYTRRASSPWPPAPRCRACASWSQGEPSNTCPRADKCLAWLVPRPHSWLDADDGANERTIARVEFPGELCNPHLRHLRRGHLHLESRRFASLEASDGPTVQFVGPGVEPDA